MAPRESMNTASTAAGPGPAGGRHHQPGEGGRGHHERGVLGQVEPTGARGGVVAAPAGASPASPPTCTTRATADPGGQRGPASSRRIGRHGPQEPAAGPGGEQRPASPGPPRPGPAAARRRPAGARAGPCARPASGRRRRRAGRSWRRRSRRCRRGSRPPRGAGPPAPGRTGSTSASRPPTYQRPAPPAEVGDDRRHGPSSVTSHRRRRDRHQSGRHASITST